MSTLYENICFYCERANISGSKLCNEIGISKSTLSSLKTGRTKRIHTDNLAKMAERLGVTVDDLLGTTEQKEKPALKTESELNLEDIKLLIKKLSSSELVELMGDIADKLKEKDNKSN